MLTIRKEIFCLSQQFVILQYRGLSEKSLPPFSELDASLSGEYSLIRLNVQIGRWLGIKI
jgi:hypothetical protein